MSRSDKDNLENFENVSEINPQLHKGALRLRVYHRKGQPRSHGLFLPTPFSLVLGGRERDPGNEVVEGQNLVQKKT